MASERSKGPAYVSFFFISMQENKVQISAELLKTLFRKMFIKEPETGFIGLSIILLGLSKVNLRLNSRFS